MEGAQNIVRTVNPQSYNLLNKELVIDMVINLAVETENKKLDRELIYQSVLELVNTPNFGFYQLSFSGETICGMNLVTYEYNIKLSKKVIWLQTVYVDKQFRSKGVFKGLLGKLCEITRNTDENFYNRLKLYMEKDNQTAHQVYLKSGFRVTEDILFELDFYFDKFDRNDYKSSLPPNTKLSQLTNENISFIEKEVRNSLFVDFCNSDNNSQVKEDISSHLNSIKFILDNKNTAEVVVLTDENTGRLIALFYIFIEYSDWRKSVFWWVDSIKVSFDHVDFFAQNMNIIIKSLVDLALNLNKCGLRIISDPKAENYWTNTCIPKSHYLILEKIVEN
jgi:GNAT superfamily N-acetyltransferase